MLDSRVKRTRCLLIGEPRGVIDEQASSFDFRGHVGELELDGLEFADGFAELLALLGVLHRGIQRALRHAQRQRGDGDAAAVENFQAARETFAFWAEQIFTRNAAIGENDFGGVAGAHAQLVFFFAGAKTGHALFQDERADAVRAFAICR